MPARVKDSLPTSIRSSASALLLLLLLCVLLVVPDVTASTTSQGLRLKVERDGHIASLNPAVFIVGQKATFRCFCLFTNLTTVELLRNQFPIGTGPCSPFFYTIPSINLDDRGEYSCRSTPSYLNTSAEPIESKIRELSVLDPDDVVDAPPKQYAIYGSSYTFQCNITSEHSAVISWWALNGTQLSEAPHSYRINNVLLSHEEEYECRVILDQFNIDMKKRVRLFVLVPPNITQPLPSDLTLHGNPTHTLSISFQSRFHNNTTVEWYWNGHSISDGIETTFSGDPLDPSGTSHLYLGQVSRASHGTYSVQVSNSFPSIPSNQRVATSSVRLSVVVPPVVPAEITAHHVSKSQVRLEWALPHQHNDEAADWIILSLLDSAGVEHGPFSMPGSKTSLLATVIPGVAYTVQLIVRNVDGSASTEPYQFTARSDVPNITSISVKRLNMTSFHITATFLYTGGGDITHFLVAIKKRNGTVWSLPVEVLANRSAGTELKWSGIVMSARLGEPSAVQVVAVNEEQHKSRALEMREPLIRFSAPSTPVLLSSSQDSLTFSLTLPNEGTPPILHLIVNFTSPNHFQWSCIGARSLGEELPCTVPRLSPNTAYTLTVYAMGYAGVGNASSQVTFSTATVDNSLPMWVVAVVAVVVAITVLTVLLALLLVIVHCCRLHQKQRNYQFNTKKATEQTAPKPLEPSHSILNRKKSSLSTLNESPSTPPSLTSPSSSITATSNQTPSTTTTINRYETTSSSSCSNLESEVSEAQSPTYTYRISPLPREVHAHSYSPRLHTSSHHSTRESLSSLPPAPKHHMTNV